MLAEFLSINSAIFTNHGRTNAGGDLSAKEKGPRKSLTANTKPLPFPGSRTQSNVSVQQPMKSFRAFGQLCQVPFQRLCERVKQRPDVPPFKCIMGRLTPLMQHLGDQTIGAHADIGSANDQVNWQSVNDTGSGTGYIFSVPIGSNTQIFMRLTLTNQAP